MAKTPEQRFWAKVNMLGDCWEWTGSNSRGHPTFHVGTPAGRKTVYAHRLMYSHYVGPIPPQFYIDHRCRNAMCVRPEHLRLATPKQNQENRSGAQSNSGTGVRGVQRNSLGKYVAMVKHHGVNHYVGYFASLADAAEAVAAKRNELFTHNDADRTSCE